jgi:hypothetical protein
VSIWAAKIASNFTPS